MPQKVLEITHVSLARSLSQAVETRQFVFFLQILTESSTRGPTRSSSSHDDTASVTVEDVMEDFRSILRSQQHQLAAEFEERKLAAPRRPSSRGSITHIARSPSPRTKSAHGYRHQSSSSEDRASSKKGRTASSSSSGSKVKANGGIPTRLDCFWLNRSKQLSVYHS